MSEHFMYHGAAQALQTIRNEMRVRLARQYADQIDGVHLDGFQVGDVLDLPPDEARILLAEEWAIPDPYASERPRQPFRHVDLERAS